MPRSTRIARRAPARQGHTLVEMVIVMSLMAVIAGMALPRLNYSVMRLDANTRALRGAMQQAWRLSIQKQHDVLVSVDVSTHRLRIVEDVNNDGLASAGERVTWKPLEEGATFGVPPAGLTGSVTVPFSGTGVRTLAALPTLVFRRNGSTSGDAEVYLSATHKGETSWRALTIAQATGRTEWFRRVNGAWTSGGN